MKYTAVLRIEKRKKADLKKMAAHNERDTKLGISHTDTKLIGAVRDAILSSKPIWKRVLDRVLTAHQDFFAVDRGVKAEKLQAAALEFSLELWGKENVVSVMLHDDEAAPHIHVVAVPRDGDTLSWNKFIKTKFDLSRLQDRWHAIANAHGLALGRGNPAKDTKSKHSKPRRPPKPKGLEGIVKATAAQMGVLDDVGQYSTLTLAEVNLMRQNAFKDLPAPLPPPEEEEKLEWKWKAKKLTR
jgi:Plasmid recombination enzyme